EGRDQCRSSAEGEPRDLEPKPEQEDDGQRKELSAPGGRRALIGCTPVGVATRPGKRKRRHEDRSRDRDGEVSGRGERSEPRQPPPVDPGQRNGNSGGDSTRSHPWRSCLPPDRLRV